MDDGVDARATSIGWAVATRVVVSALAIWLAFQWDDRAVSFLAQPIPSAQTQGALRNLRCWGEGVTVVILSLGWVFAKPGGWRVGATMALAALGVGISVEIMKPLASRPRPNYALNPSAASASDRVSSFPSGHTATAFAVARIWSLAMPAVRPVCFAAAVGTGLSRMYEQRHYLSDCVVGALVGWHLAWLMGIGLDRNKRWQSTAGRENL